MNARAFQMSARAFHALASAIALAALAVTAPANATERLVVSLSNHRVAITSNFVGEDLVLFGTIELDATSAPPPRGYDLVVTVAGPRQTYRNRRKERVLGIWVNVDSREFIRVPSYLTFLSNRPFSDIAGAPTLRQLQVGLNNYLLTQRIGPDIGDTVQDDPFRVSFVRLEEQSGLFIENSKAVTFLTPTVFRTTIPLPANVPTGAYAIDVMLFANGQLTGRTNTALEITKVGFEQFVADAARDHGFIYGLIAAIMALITGWAASVVFRRD